MKDLVRTIVQELVNHPDQIELFEIEGQQSFVIELKVAKEDCGKVIGKNGQTANAIRTLLNAAYARNGKRISLEILE